MDSYNNQNNSTACLTSTTITWTSKLLSNSSSLTSSPAALTLTGQRLSISSISILMALCCLAILNNMFTCYLIYTNKILHTATNIFILSLCITDIFCAGALVPVAVFYKGSIIYLYLTGITVFTYAANLTAVTYERLVSITKPLQYRSIVTKKRALQITLVAWIIPISYCLLPITWGTDTNSLEHKIFLIFGLLLFLVIPLFFICFVYIRIFVEVHRLLKNSRHLVVYSFEDDSEAANETVLRRLQNSCISISNRCGLRMSCRNTANEKQNCAMEESNEESSQTYKSEFCTSTMVQDSPHVQSSQKKLQKHIAIRSHQKRLEDSKEICDTDNSLQKYDEENAEIIAAINGSVCESVQKDLNSKVTTIAQITSKISLKDMSDSDILKEACTHENDVRVYDETAAANYEAPVVTGSKCSAKSIIAADTIYKEEELAEQSCIREVENATFITSEEDLPIKKISHSCDDDNKKGRMKNVKSKKAVPIGKRKKSNRRQQIFDEIRASTAFAAVAFTYMFTWIPVIYMTFMEAIGRIELIPENIENANVWTIALNATIDPLFYALILRNFRKVIRKKLRQWRNRYN